MPLNKPIRIAVAGDITHPDIREFIRGVGIYVRRHSGWEVRVAEPPLESVLMLGGSTTSRARDIAGVLADFDDPRIVNSLSGFSKPVVAFGGEGPGTALPESVPYFYSDNEAIGRLGADHLVAAGYRHFAFCGYRKTPLTGWSVRRARAFRARLAERGFQGHEFSGPVRRGVAWSDARKGLPAWLATLPRPCGLMACNDVCALRALDGLHRLPARIPEEFGVVGVDNDEMLCELAFPTLSSIDLGYRHMGFEAAALLDRMMAGDQPADRRSVVPPARLVVRATSDITLTDDPRITAALQFIREKAGAVAVRDVVKQTALGRLTLDKRFKRYTGHTVQAEIEKVRLERIKVLLEDMALSLKEIAYEVGFRHASYLTAFFKKKTGTSPSAYRDAERRRWNTHA